MNSLIPDIMLNGSKLRQELNQKDEIIKRLEEEVSRLTKFHEEKGKSSLIEELTRTGEVIGNLETNVSELLNSNNQLSETLSKKTSLINQFKDKVSELQSQNSELLKQSSDLKTNNKGLGSKVAEMFDKNTQLSNELQRKDVVISELEAEKNCKDYNINELKDQKLKLSDELKRTNSNLNEIKFQSSEFRTKLREALQESNKRARTITELENTISGLETKYKASFTDSVNKSSIENQQQQETVVKLESEIKNLSAELEMKTQLMEALESQVLESQASQKNILLEAAEKSTLIKELETTVSELETRNGELQEDLKEKTRLMRQMENTVYKLQSKSSELSDNIPMQQSEATIIKLQEEVNNLKEDSEKRLFIIESLNTSISELETKNEYLRMELDEKDTTIEESHLYKSCNEKLSKELKDARKRLSRSDTLNEKYINEIKRLGKKVTGNDSTVKNLNSTIFKLESTIQKLKEKLAENELKKTGEIEETFDDLLAKNRILANEKSKKDITIKRLESQLVQLQNKYKFIEEKTEAQVINNNNLTSKLTKTEESKDKILDIGKAWKEKAENLTKELKAKDDLFTKLQIELDAANTDREKIISNAIKLEVELQKLKMNFKILKKNNKRLEKLKYELKDELLRLYREFNISGFADHTMKNSFNNTVNYEATIRAESCETLKESSKGSSNESVYNNNEVMPFSKPSSTDENKDQQDLETCSSFKKTSKSEKFRSIFSTLTLKKSDSNILSQSN